MDACLSGHLGYSTKSRPRHVKLQIQSGHVYVFENHARKYIHDQTDDESPWESVEDDGTFAIWKSKRLIKKEIEVEVQDLPLHLISYYDQWDVVANVVRPLAHDDTFLGLFLSGKIAVREQPELISSSVDAFCMAMRLIYGTEGEVQARLLPSPLILRLILSSTYNTILNEIRYSLYLTGQKRKTLYPSLMQ